MADTETSRVAKGERIYVFIVYIYVNKKLYLFHMFKSIIMR